MLLNSSVMASGTRKRFVSGASFAAMTSAMLVWGAGSAKADCVVTVPTGTTIASNYEVGCSSPAGQTTSPSLNPGQATGANNAIVSVTGVTISQPAGGQPRQGIAATTIGTGGVTVNVTDTTITDMKTTGPSLGINITVNPGNSTAVADGVLTLSGTNSITIGQFDPITGLPTTPGSGGGILVNVRGAGNATTTISGTLDVLVNSGTGSGSIAKDDGVETTARAGTATLDMTGITGASTISVNAGNGLFIDSLPSTPNTSGGNVVVVGVSDLVTINVDNSIFGVANPSTTTAVANAGILAATFGSGTVNIEGTSATINTTGPFADGIHAITQTGTVAVNNSGAITTTGPTSHGIEATTTNVTPTLPIYGTAGATTPGTTAPTTVYSQQLIAVTGMPDLALSGFPATGAVSVTNNGVITTSGGGSATAASNGIYAWTLSGGAGASGDVTVVNNAGGNVTTSGDFSNAILATATNTSTGAAGAIDVTNAATLTTSGANADGISAIASGTTAGPITIDNSGSVISRQAVGVSATATAGTNLTIANEGVIFGGTAGIRIGGVFDPQIDNTGTIGALNDLAIDSSALTSGPLTINNNVGGIITGYVTLGNGVNTLNNAGLWNLRNFNATTGTLGVAVADFGTSGSNVVNNTGTIALLGAPVPGAPVNSTGQYLPLAPGSVSNATVNNPLNAMAAGGPVQGQILGVQTFNNAGVIDLTANAVAGDVLVISGGHTAGQDGGGVFVANGGTLRLNTVLNEGGANSQSDMLVVDSTRLGSAPTGIVVNNAGGGGAQTVGNGIALVEVLNKGASADGVFALSGRAAAGAFEYDLFHNGVGADAADGNWYLRTAGFRPEVPVDTIVPALASQLGLAMLGTISNRTGDVFSRDGSLGPGQFCADDVETRRPGVYVKARPPKVECNTLLWGRVFGETGSAGSGGNGNGGFGSAGPAYTFDYGGFQAGADLYRTARDSAGLYAGVATTQADVKAANGGPAGRVGMDAYGVGGYWTHRNPTGWYTDLVLQGNWYENIHAHSFAGQSLDTQGWGITASAETGYTIALGGSYSVIPQAQLVYQRTSIDGGADQFGRISFNATDEIYGRLGARFAKGWLTNDGRTVTTWVDTNFWHQFGADAQTTFSNLQGLNPTTVSASLGGTWAQIGLGLSGQLTRNVSVFGRTDYNISLNQPGHSLGGRAGIRVNW